MMNHQADFYARKLAEWQAKSKAASEAADLKAWEHAEREIENYRQMLERVK